MPALDEAVLADAAALAERTSAGLRALGRLPHPMLRSRGDRGFTRISWEKALDLASERLRATTPERLGFYLTSRGTTNETYYVAQKAVRALGTNSIDNAARVCHSPSTFGLKEALGVAASTCSYRDWIGTDLIVFIGSNPANNQPVTTKYLHLAKKAGTRVAVVNPYREPGMERYWVPSNVESALFGTRIADRFFELRTGGDAGFLAGAMKALIDHGGVDESFVAEHTTGFAALAEELAAVDWDRIERLAGTSRAEIEAFARMLAEAERGVLVWSMGVTQHAHGEDNVRAIVNLALARGFIGREGCGLMPIRGHSGVQGGAEMGCYATALPGGAPISSESAAALGNRWGFEVPTAPGLTAPEMLDAAGSGDLDVLFSAGGNFLEILPEPERVRAALAAVPLRIHMDIVLSSQMLVDPAEHVLLLPATTRYEVPGGVTETSTERRVIFSPEVRGPRIAEARPEWEIFSELAARARPELSEAVRFADTDAIRAEIAQAVPLYRGIEKLRERGDQFQYGGRLLCAGNEFPTADGKARFSTVSLPSGPNPDGRLVLSTRRGKQFNSMVQERRDGLTGAGRESVLISAEDAARLEIGDGGDVIVVSDSGELRGRALIAPIAPGNVQVQWPEGNVLIGAEHRSPEAGIPDYNALVEVHPVAE
jgi:molybdopterin-dependent oxidoreductase alpha subunit